MLAAGLRPEDFVAESFEIWPENEKSIALFSSLSTQWRMGFSGPTGLDYNVLFTRMARMGLDDAEYESLFQDIRVIESEALTIINTREQ
jgi:hypothetical protein